MPYIDQAAMEARFGQQTLIDLTDRNGTGLVDATVLSSAIDSAEARVNGYIGARYQLPLTTVPQDVVDASLALARYFLDGDNGNEIVRQRYADAIAYLKDVQAGRAVLSGVDVPVAVEKAAGSVSMSSQDSVFARGSR